MKNKRNIQSMSYTVNMIHILLIKAYELGVKIIFKFIQHIYLYLYTIYYAVYTCTIYSIYIYILYIKYDIFKIYI